MSENYVDIVFDGPPSQESGRFVEAESPAGKSVNIGGWIDRKDGYWALRIKGGDIPTGNDAPLFGHSKAEYKVVAGLSLGDLDAQVTALLRQGWRLIGAPLVVAPEHTHALCYYREMERGLPSL
jgi:hypothetical protein